MSVESIYTRVIAQGDGANTKFGFQWKFIDESDIVVYVDDALIPSSEYSLEYPITKTSGSVVFNTAPAVGAIVVIKRAVNEQQSRMFKNTAQFNANEVEKAFDKLTMLVQEQLEGIRRQALTLASQSNVDWKVEDLTKDDVLLAVDFDAKKLIQTSFTQEEVQAVIDEAVRSVGYTVKNIEWDGTKATFTFGNGATMNSVVSPNVAQLRVAQNEKGDYFFQWSLDGIIWNSSGTGILSIHNDLTGREAENAHPIAAITALQTAIEWLGARSSVFEIMPTLAPLNREVYGQKIYTNVYPSDFTRIPVKTFQENDAALDNVIIDFSQFLRVGSYVVDENGTIGVVENFNGDNTLYKSITITTLSPGYAKEIVALNTNAALKTTDFETPITAFNKGATMREIDFINNTTISSKNFANCITEIPQDIKLELTDGTLTLKAGSKIYVPNGFTEEGTQQYYGWAASYQPPFISGTTVYTTTESPQVGTQIFDIQGNSPILVGQIESAKDITFDGIVVQGYGFTRDTSKDTTISIGAGIPKFDEITIESDLTRTTFGEAVTALLYYVPSANGLTYEQVSTSSSGTSHTPTAYSVWYDTANNVINRYQSNVSTPASTVSLPIAIIKTSSSAITSIDQTFNGFGYIGSTIFGLKGVKVLVPNGKNPDGTNNNYTYTLPTVITRQVSGTGINLGVSVNTTANEFGVGNYSYSEGRNTVSGSSGVLPGRVMIGRATYTSSVISNLKTKRVYQALDYNDIEYIAHLSAPTNRYIDFDVGAHGTYYTAPADGWFVIISTNSQVANGSIGLTNASNEITNQTYIANTNAVYGAAVRVAKGQRVQAKHYGQDISTLTIRFVFALGAK